MERRVWSVTGRRPIYPNLFTLLVAPPAVGKTEAINNTREFWRATKRLYVAPNSVTKASLIDVVAKSARKLVIDNGQGLIEYHSLGVASSEFGVLVPSHDTEFLNVMNDIYDNPPNYSEERRHMKGAQVDIVHPQLNILAGTQPGYLAALLPEEAWSMGFMSRMIMVYSGTGPMIDLFPTDEDEIIQAPKSMIAQLVALTKLTGRMTWTEDAKLELHNWQRSGCPPLPEHSKLAHYNGRRILHLIKLSIIAAISRTGGIVIHRQDLTRARDWLLQAEVLMPDVFREMVGKSDHQVITELHFFLWQLWVKDKKPIHESRIFDFLRVRLPSEKVLRVIEVAERSNVISRNAGTQSYIPRHKHEFGTE